MKSHTEKFEKLRPAHVRRASAVLDEVRTRGRPADQALQALYKAHREMGSRDRALIGGLVYGVLRDVRRLERVAASSEAMALCAVIAIENEVPGDVLTAAGCANAAALAAQVAQFDAAQLTAAERLNVPDASYVRWRERLGDEADALAEALRREAPVDLRVNTLRATREAAMAALAEEGITAEPTTLSPIGLRLPKRVALQNTRAFRSGWVEPQDEGSQVLALLVGARPGEQVIDWCAGAGGKALALAARMENRGRILACDSSKGRLQRMGERLERAGVSIVTARVLASDAAIPEPADAVLVDAPCSASGTWRRNPELRLRELDLAALAATQSEILEQAARSVRPGGRLVYATCSLYVEENEAVAEAFLAAHPEFAIEDAGASLRDEGVSWEGEYLRLWPHRHGTDGFFAVRLRRL